jgi:GNAT superfamily N-acetyltransferase
MILQRVKLITLRDHRATEWESGPSASYRPGFQVLRDRADPPLKLGACWCNTALIAGTNSMARHEVTISARHDLSAADVGHLKDRLYDHIRRAIGRDDGKKLAFAAPDTDGRQVGGIAGYTWARMAEIKQLWVDDARRGFGIGRRLLEAVIAEAIHRNCQCIWVMSYEFQAPGLYEKCGFEQAAELRDWPPGHSNFVLRRGLQKTE